MNMVVSEQIAGTGRNMDKNILENHNKTSIMICANSLENERYKPRCNISNQNADGN